MNKLYIFMLSFSLIFSAIEIESLNPNEGEAGSNLTVELVASGANFLDFYDSYGQVDGINFNVGGEDYGFVNVDSFNVTSETTIAMNLSIAKIPPVMFDVELVGSFYDSYDQYFYEVSKDAAFYVSSNNPLLVVESAGQSFDDFGLVNVSESSTIYTVLWNPSTVNLEIYGISMSNSDFTIDYPPVIEPGEYDYWPITFSPSSSGEQNNTMTIYSNDEFDPIQVFQMSGSGFAILGDMNSDGTLNILDIVALIGYVFNDNTNPDADLNGDGTVNIVDVVMLVNLVLNWGF